jgi:hypothetical protein
MVKCKVTYRNPTIPISLKKLVELRATTPEEAWEELRTHLEKHPYLLGDTRDLLGVEQQETAR